MKKSNPTKKVVKVEKCNHAIAVHEGHDLEYWKSTKYAIGATKESLSDDCCGGVTLFNFCPFCGKKVRVYIESITNFKWIFSSKKKRL